VTDQYLLRRVEPPRGTGLSDHSMRETNLGGQSGWSWGMPGVYQALAAPRSYCAVPAKPRDESPHEASLGYWAALHHLLIYRLGWSRPDRGLRWWYDSGKPTEDPTLAFLAEVWDRDRTLDRYLAWLLTRGVEFHTNSSPIYLDGPRPLPRDWESWLAQNSQVYDSSSNVDHHFFTEGDTFHLNRHLQSTDPSSEATITVTKDRHAVLVTADAESWYATLGALGATLAPLNNRSWYVDVFVKPIGFMGTFRQSRSSGNWFSGQHRIHSPGNR
jgi:hypothetical protein